LAYFSYALPLSRAVGDRNAEAQTLFGAGIANLNLGRKSDSLEHLRQSLLIFRSLKNTQMEKMIQGIIESNNNTGSSQSSRPIDRAVSLINEGKRLFIEGSNSSLSLAQQKLLEAIKICQTERDKLCLASSLQMIGMISDRMGDKRKALEHFTGALSLSRELRDQSKESNLLFAMGMIYFDLRDRSNSLSHFNQALSIFRNIGNSEMERTVQGMIAKLKS
jgi:tetratricopeptide (TPR) repeat protein